jgi:DNA topoisomerase-3
MKLVIAEKPSVAQAIGKIIGAYKREDGYLEGSGYLVSWCVGHLVELAQPQIYDEKYTKWRYEDLPILPENWQTVVSEKTKKQYRILQTLMKRNDVESVVNACDAGREGEAIFRMVYEKVGCQKPMLRLWIRSMEDEAIREGFENLRPSVEYDRLYQSAKCRSKADWLVGINGTRLFSTQYGKKITIGRVQTPTLAMLTERKLQIEQFKKETFYRVHIAGNGCELISEETYTKEQAELIASQCDGTYAVITQFDCVKKNSNPPKLYDLTTLQREANRYYGFTAKQTLDYTQKLYEAKLVTYPRTDSQYLTEDMKESVIELVKNLSNRLPFSEEVMEISNVDNTINNKKVTDHHAIIPTKASLNATISDLSKGEQAIFYLISQRLLAATSEVMTFQERVIKAECADVSFIAKGKTVTKKGWTAIEEAFVSSIDGDKKKQKEKLEDTVPVFAEKGSVIPAVTTSVSEHFTAPPKAYTEDTLLLAMERAGKGEFDKETEKKGLGTPATRAGIIEKLVSIGYVLRKGRQLYATYEAVKLMEILPDVIKSPMLTAEWENQLLQMEQGQVTEEDFMQSITRLVEKLVCDYSQVDATDRAMIGGTKEEQIALCPRCGSPVVERKQTYGCSARDCDFVLWKNNKFMQSIGLSFTRNVADSLLTTGEYLASGLVSKKTGKRYSAKIKVVDNGGKYPSYEMEFVKKKKKEG